MHSKFSSERHLPREPIVCRQSPKFPGSSARHYTSYRRYDLQNVITASVLNQHPAGCFEGGVRRKDQEQRSGTMLYEGSHPAHLAAPPMKPLHLWIWFRFQQAGRGGHSKQTLANPSLWPAPHRWQRAWAGATAGPSGISGQAALDLMFKHYPFAPSLAEIPNGFAQCDAHSTAFRISEAMSRHSIASVAAIISAIAPAGAAG